MLDINLKIKHKMSGKYSIFNSFCNLKSTWQLGHVDNPRSQRLEIKQRRPANKCETMRICVQIWKVPLAYRILKAKATRRERWKRPKPEWPQMQSASKRICQRALAMSRKGEKKCMISLSFVSRPILLVFYTSTVRIFKHSFRRFRNFPSKLKCK